MPSITPGRARWLAAHALENANTAPANAAIVADALVAAECDGLASHGLSRVAAYAEQAAAGKVDGHAAPVIAVERASAVVIDARHGFAYPAIELGTHPAVDCARASGSCVLAIAHSHHAGVLGAHVERFARHGMIALAFANAPAAIAPWGGSKRLYGTNPIAFAAPRDQAAPLVIDLSVSTVARGHVMLAQQRGKAIPEGWALDAYGAPTTNADAAMAGTMLPLGGAKGAALALVVEIMAAVLTGSALSAEASSLFTPDDGPPDLGQSFIVIDPQTFAGPGFGARLETLLAAIVDQPGVRLPGARRIVARAASARAGIEISDALLADLERRAGLS